MKYVRAIGDALFLVLIVVVLYIAIVTLVEWTVPAACATSADGMAAVRAAQRECLDSGGTARLRGDPVEIICEEKGDE